MDPAPVNVINNHKIVEFFIFILRGRVQFEAIKICEKVTFVRFAVTLNVKGLQL